MFTTRPQDAEFRAAWDAVNLNARYIANCVVAGVEVPAEALAAYTQAHGQLDRLVELMAGAR